MCIYMYTCIYVYMYIYPKKSGRGFGSWKNLFGSFRSDGAQPAASPDRRGRPGPSGAAPSAILAPARVP